MQNLDSEVLGIVSSWQNSSKNIMWQKKATLIEKELENISNLLEKFDENENEFLQNFYINSSDGDLRSLKILDLSYNYNHAEYFFHDRFFEPNLEIFYYDFIFKNKIINAKPLFEGANCASVNSVITNDDKKIIALYVFIENIVKNFNAFANDKNKKDEFKHKIINFYESVYKIFATLSLDLSVTYFDFILHNHPFILIEFIKKALKTDEIANIEFYLSDEGMLNLKDNKDSLETIKKDELYAITSIFSIYNKNNPSCFYTATSLEFLEKIYNNRVEMFIDFSDLSTKFIDDYSPFPSNASFTQKFIYSSFFFNFASEFKNKSLSKNLIIISTLGDKKDEFIKDIIESKKLKNDKFRICKLQKNSSYSDFIDGFRANKFINGEFKNFAKIALSDPGHEYFFIVDNTSGADLDEIFAESANLIKNRYNPNNIFSIARTRNSHIIDTFEKEEKEKFSLVLKDGFSYFAISDNLYIICILRGDFAGLSPNLAKNFDYLKLACDYENLQEKIKNIKNSQIFIEICKKLNDYINKESRLNYQIDENLFAQITNFTNSNLNSENLLNFFNTILTPILISAFKEKNNDLSYSSVLADIKEFFKI